MPELMCSKGFCELTDPEDPFVSDVLYDNELFAELLVGCGIVHFLFYTVYNIVIVYINRWLKEPKCELRVSVECVLQEQGLSVSYGLILGL